MGYDASVDVVVGWCLKPSKILKRFMKISKEESHMEKRFNPKTGKPVAPVKIIDRASYKRLEVGDKTFEMKDADEFFKHLTKSAQSGYQIIGPDDLEDPYVDEFGTEPLVYVTINLEKANKGMQGDPLSTGPDLWLPANIGEMIRDIQKEFLARFEMELGTAKVMLQVSQSC